MSFVFANPNPHGLFVGDCVVRALSILLDQSWEKTYTDLTLQGFVSADMPSANHVWAAYLDGKGFSRETIPNTCPACYTVEEFAADHDKGRFLVATGSHVVAVIDGDYYDAWDSGKEVPAYYFYRKDDVE